MQTENRRLLIFGIFGSSNEPEPYVVVASDTLEVVTQEVNRRMAAGWLPAGGLAIDTEGFYQAMTRPALPNVTPGYRGE